MFYTNALVFYYAFLLPLALVTEQAYGSQTVLYASSGGYVRQGLSDELVCKCSPSACATLIPAKFYKKNITISPSSEYRFPSDRKLVILNFGYDKEGAYSCAIEGHASPEIELRVKLPLNITLPAAAKVQANERAPLELKIKLVTPQRPVWVNFSRIPNGSINLRCRQLVHPSTDEQVAWCLIPSASLDDEGRYQVAVGANWYGVKIMPFDLEVQVSELNLSCTASTPTSINVSLSYVPKWKYKIVLKSLTKETKILAPLQKNFFEVDQVDNCTNYEVTVVPTNSPHKPSTCAVKSPCLLAVTAMNVTRYKNRIFQQCGKSYRELCILVDKNSELVEKEFCDSARKSEVLKPQMQIYASVKIKLEEISSLTDADLCAKTVTNCPYILQCKKSETDASNFLNIIIIVLSVVGVALLILFFCVCLKNKNKDKFGESEASSTSPSKRTPTDKQLHHLSKMIIGQEEFVARALGVADTRINIIIENYTNVEKRSYRLLKAWKLQKGRDATVRSLCNALIEEGLRQPAEEIFGLENTWGAL